MNVSRSGLLFSSAQSLEIGTVVEINLDLQELVGSEKLRYGVVVRRVLMAWPDVDTLVGVQFMEDCSRPGQPAGDQIAG